MYSAQTPTIVAVLVGTAGAGKRTLFEAYSTCTVEPDSPALAKNRPRLNAEPVDSQGNTQVSDSCIVRTRRMGETDVKVLLHCVTLGREGEPMDSTVIPALSSARAVIYVYDLLDDPTFAASGDLTRAVGNIRRLRSSLGVPQTFVIGAKSDLVENAELCLKNAAPHLSKAPRYAVSAKTDPQHATATIDEIVYTVKAQMDGDTRPRKSINARTGRHTRNASVSARRRVQDVTPVYGTTTETDAIAPAPPIELIDHSTAARTLAASELPIVLESGSDEESPPAQNGNHKKKVHTIVDTDGNWEDSRPCTACATM